MNSYRFELLERYRVPGPGRLDAWSIQGRYGLVLVAVSAVLFMPVIHLAQREARVDGGWALGALALVTFAVGLAVSRLRETLRVTPEAVLLSRRRLFSERRVAEPRDSIEAVRLTAVRESDDSGTRTIFPVSLAFESRDEARAIAVFKPTDELRAREAAHEIAEALALPVIDAIGDKEIIEDAPGRSVRSVGEADSRANGPPPTLVSEGVRAGTACLALTVQGVVRPQVATRLWWAGFGFLLLASGAGFAASRAIEPAAIGWVIPFPFWGAGLYFLVEARLGCMIREHLWVEGCELIRERSIARFRFSRSRVQIEDIEAVRVQTTRGDEWGLAVVGRRERFVVGAALDADALGWLEARLRRMLGE